MAKAKNTITKEEMVIIKLSDHWFDYRLVSLRSQKAHATRWINEDLTIIAQAERILATTPEDGTDQTAVRRSNALEMAHRYNLSLDRHRAIRVGIELDIAKQIAFGKQLVAERAATPATAEGSR
jgi:hypothetical protein